MPWIGPLIGVAGGLIGNAMNQGNANSFAGNARFDPISEYTPWAATGEGTATLNPRGPGQAYSDAAGAEAQQGYMGLKSLGNGVQGYGSISPELMGVANWNSGVQGNLPGGYMGGQQGNFMGLTNQFGGLARQGLSQGLPPQMQAQGAITNGYNNPGSQAGGYLGGAGAQLLGGGGPNTGAPTWQGNYNNMLGALQQQAAPGQNLQEMNLLNNLQSSGNIGSTAGQYQQQGLQTALQSQNAGYQAMAMQNANTLAQQNVQNQQANLGLGGAFMGQMGSLGLQGQNQAFGQGNTAASQQQAFNQAYFGNAMNSAQNYGTMQGMGYGQELNANNIAAARAQQMFGNYSNLFNTGSQNAQGMLSGGFNIGNTIQSQLQNQINSGLSGGAMQSAANYNAYSPLLNQQTQLGNGIGNFAAQMASQYKGWANPSTAYTGNNTGSNGSGYDPNQYNYTSGQDNGQTG